MLRRGPGLVLLVSLVGFGCGSGASDGGPDASDQPDAGMFVEAMPGSLPQLVSLGGATLAHPKVQPIFFTGDASMQAQIEDFAGQLAASSYWTTTTAEYGVGPLTVLPTLVVTTPPPTTVTAVESLLSNQLDGTHSGWSYDASTIYSVFLPAGVVVTDTDGTTSCDDYDAFHSESTGKHGEPIVYALMPRCVSDAPVLDDLTSSVSHEWIEAATDPLVTSAPAFGDADAPHYIWAYTPGAEAADYCQYLANAYQRLVGNYMVQRSWSNASSAAGHDPCVPVLSEPYVSAAPVMVEDVSVVSQVDGETPVETKGIAIPLGTSKTIDVQLYSDQSTGDFTVSAVDAAADFGTPADAELSFQWDKTTGHNGDRMRLTIKRIRTGKLPGSEFEIVASSGDHASNIWWSFAAN